LIGGHSTIWNLGTNPKAKSKHTAIRPYPNSYTRRMLTPKRENRKSRIDAPAWTKSKQRHLHTTTGTAPTPPTSATAGSTAPPPPTHSQHPRIMKEPLAHLKLGMRNGSAFKRKHTHKGGVRCWSSDATDARNSSAAASRRRCRGPLLPSLRVVGLGHVIG